MYVLRAFLSVLFMTQDGTRANKSVVSNSAASVANNAPPPSYQDHMQQQQYGTTVYTSPNCSQAPAANSALHTPTSSTVANLHQPKPLTPDEQKQFEVNAALSWYSLC